MAATLGSRAGRPLQELLPDLAASLSVLYPLPGYQKGPESEQKRPQPLDPREKAAKQAEAVQEQLRLQFEQTAGPSGSRESVQKLAKAKAQAHPKKGAKKEGLIEGERGAPVTVKTAKCKEAEIAPKPKKPKEPKEKASQAKRTIDVKPSTEGMQGIQSICTQSPSGKSLKRPSNTQSEKMKSQKAKDQKQKDLAKLPQGEAKTKLKVQESQKAQKAKKLKTGEELKDQIDSQEIGFRSAPSEKSSEVLRGARPIQSIRSMEMNVVQPASKFPMASELTIFMQNLAARKNLRA